MGRHLLMVVGAASVTVAVAFALLELALPDSGGAGTYVTASAAIVVAAAVAGLFAGLLAVLMSSAVVVYLHLPPLGVLHVDRVDELTGLALFAVGGLVVAAVGSLARRGLTRPAGLGADTSASTLTPVDAALMPAPAPVPGPWNRRWPGRAEPLVEALTTREVEVLEALAAGMSNEGIAASLYVSVNTVKTHLKNVYGKLEVTSRTQAVARAHELGVIGFPARHEAHPIEQLAA